MRLFLQSVAVVLIIILVVSLTMAALGKMSWKVFWVIALIEAIAAHYYKKHKERQEDL